MCGIVGWAVARGKSQSAGTLLHLANLLAHRGPDGAGHWLGHTADGRCQIGLGHRRLSIIDIGGGVQPMWSGDRAHCLVFNGEIYNYIELRDELRRLGHGFRTESDTEVLLAAYRQWGVTALSRLRGMFAFALWDATRQCLLLARDPFGKKPLFIAGGEGFFVFGSEIDPVLAFPGVGRNFNVAALGHYLLNRYVPGPATFFRGVQKLQPGCYGVWGGGDLAISRYFTPPSGTTEPDIVAFEDALALFETTFDDAVRIRMRSDAPYGAYLSGGIDSSAVVAAMSRHSGARIRTFSVGFEDARYSELDHARTVASHFGTDHHELVVTPQAFMEHWPSALRSRGAPVSEASDIPIMMLSRMASQSVKMVLTGEGSDELLAGYPKHRAEQWITRYQRAMPGILHDGLVAPLVRALPYGFRRLKLAACAAGERDLSARMRLWFGGIPAAERDNILGHAAPSEPDNPYPYSAAIGSDVRRTLFFDQTSWLPDNLLERGDRMMMAGSIEGRMPFMDTALAQLVARFPDRFLLGRKGGKAVLRAAMDKVLPEAIVARKKVGFRVPVDEWFRGPYRNLVRELLTSSETRITRFCSTQTLRRLVDDHIEGRQNNEKALWALANLEMFTRIFNLVEGDDMPAGDGALIAMPAPRGDMAQGATYG
ncbi:MAG: asparagine synthase (glutamine-hydrolyzing) [Alphaproteobacteria bacterium]|nr:asparagine synthase (glutamine-hydrolyzing) [Alphaproteobacteria bacterium]